MISIIGAGPAGNYLAYLLAKKGWKVSVFEEHEKIGIPVQCTGIVTSAIEEIVPVRNKFLVNKLKKVRVHSRDEKLEIELKKENLILDRMQFDRYLAEKAMDAGAKYYLRHKFIDFDGRTIKFNKGNYKTDVLVGADGVHSKVTKLIGNKLRVVTGIQARVSMDTEPDVFQTYFDNDFFGWIVPENSKIARVGCISFKEPELRFKKFLTEKVGKHKIREYQSGTIPVYDRRIKVQRGNIYVLGDAAGQVKATTFGGIVQGLIGARVLFRSLVYGESYKFGLRKLNKELRYSLMMRRKLNNFKTSHYNELLRLTNQDKIKNLLSDIDRDKPSKLIFKMLWREPRYLKFLF